MRQVHRRYLPRCCGTIVVQDMRRMRQRPTRQVRWSVRGRVPSVPTWHLHRRSSTTVPSLPERNVSERDECKDMQAMRHMRQWSARQVRWSVRGRVPCVPSWHLHRRNGTTVPSLPERNVSERNRQNKLQALRTLRKWPPPKVQRRFRRLLRTVRSGHFRRQELDSVALCSVCDRSFLERLGRARV